MLLPAMRASLYFDGAQVPPAEFEDAVLRAAAGFERLGIGEGDVVCLMLTPAKCWMSCSKQFLATLDERFFPTIRNYCMTSRQNGLPLGR